MNKSKTIVGYHFTGSTLRDGRAIPAVGEWLEHVGPVVACESGLHASEHPFDALQFSPGNLLHRVELDGDLQSHGNPVDKWVGRRRRILASIDAELLLRDFARWCALQVIHLWDCPVTVREYLETGDESKRAAAWAAGAAAGDAAWAAGAAAGAAGAAAWAAARAAGDAAWDAGAAARAAQRAKFNAMIEAAFAAKEAKNEH